MKVSVPEEQETSVVLVEPLIRLPGAAFSFGLLILRLPSAAKGCVLFIPSYVPLNLFLAELDADRWRSVRFFP